MPVLAIQKDFFGNETVIESREPKAKTYPHSPAQGKRVTSRLAAEKLVTTGTAEAHRQKVLDVLKTGDYTGDEIAAKLGMKTTQTRPRISQLVDEGLIENVWQGGVKLKRRNRDNNLELVWRLR